MWVLSHWLSLKGLMFTVSVLKTLYSGQITVWTQLINPNYLFIPTTDATPHIFMLVCGTCGEQDEIQLPGNVLTVHDGAVQQHQSKLRQTFYLVFFFSFFSISLRGSYLFLFYQFSPILFFRYFRFSSCFFYFRYVILMALSWLFFVPVRSLRIFSFYSQVIMVWQFFFFHLNHNGDFKLISVRFIISSTI